MSDWQILEGDVLDVLTTLPSESVHCVVTSPPYFALRDYGVAGQIGLEATPAEFVATMVRVFREVRRVLRKDGTCWLNLGDSYAGGAGGRGDVGNLINGVPTRTTAVGEGRIKKEVPQGLKPKDLMMIPARVAIALQDDGWWLRSDIIWCKRAPMPESVTDRPTSAYEHIFLLSKQPRYYYDADAVRERNADDYKTWLSKRGENAKYQETDLKANHLATSEYNPAGRNMWNYITHTWTEADDAWLLSPEPYPNAHFATFPTEIPRRAIKAGTSEHGCCAECGAPWRRVVVDSKNHAAVKASMLGKTHEDTSRELERGKQQAWGKDKARVTKETQTTGWQPTCNHNAPIVPCTVLDPFSGAGTTVMVATRLGRRGVGIELNPKYAAMSRERIINDSPLFNTPAEAAVA